MNLELVTVWATASIREYYSHANWGIPVTYVQQEQLGNVNVKNEIQIAMDFRYPRVGDKLYSYGLVHVKALVKTQTVSSDVYYHVRAKARVAQILSECIPLVKKGGTDLRIFDNSQWGILRRLPSNTITITPTSIDVPNASLVETVYEIQQV